MEAVTYATKNGPCTYSNMCKIGEGECLVLAHSEQYWLMLHCSDNITMANLDRFLREVWCECCGHVVKYSAPKSKPLRGLIEADKKIISYEYDMGSTTYIQLEIIKYADPKKDEGKEPRFIKIIGRNDPPKIRCTNDCKEKSVAFRFGEPLCKKCEVKARTDDEDDDLVSKIVNSPRTGVCGYTGETMPKNMKLYTTWFNRGGAPARIWMRAGE